MAKVTVLRDHPSSRQGRKEVSLAIAKSIKAPSSRLALLAFFQEGRFFPSQPGLPFLGALSLAHSGPNAHLIGLPVDDAALLRTIRCSLGLVHLLLSYSTGPYKPLC